MITSEQFKERLDKLCSESQLADILINGSTNSPALGFTGLAKHLQRDALKRMGLIEIVCPYSGSINYKEDTEESAKEAHGE